MPGVIPDPSVLKPIINLHNERSQGGPASIEGHLDIPGKCALKVVVVYIR